MVGPKLAELRLKRRDEDGMAFLELKLNPSIENFFKTPEVRTSTVAARMCYLKHKFRSVKREKAKAHSNAKVAWHYRLVNKEKFNRGK